MNILNVFRYIKYLAAGFVLFAFSESSFAINGRITYQAKIVKPDGLALEASNVSFRFTILDTVGSCIMYVENYTAINMSGSGGLIAFALGNGARAYPPIGDSSTFQTMFDNSISSFSCQNTGVYNPLPNDTRRIVVQFNDGTGWQTIPAMTFNAIPYSMFSAKANDSKTLNNKSDTAFVEYSTLTGLNCDAATHALTFNGVGFSCIPVGSSTTSGISSVTTSGTVLTVAGTASAPVISIRAASFSQDGYLTSLDYAEFKAKLGTSSTEIVSTLGFAPVSAAAVTTQIENLVLATASSSAIADTLVKRNSSGNITVNDLYSNSTKTNYLDIYRPSTAYSIRLQAPNSLSADYILNLPSTSGTIGQILATDGTGNLIWINQPSVSVSQATSTADGYLSSADFNTFSNKQNATSAAIVATLGYTPVSFSTLNNFVSKSGDAMTGSLALPVNGLSVGSNQLLVSGSNTGVGGLNPNAKFSVFGGAAIGSAWGASAVADGKLAVASNIGIGVANPSYGLHVLNTGSNAAYFNDGFGNGVRMVLQSGVVPWALTAGGPTSPGGSGAFSFTNSASGITALVLNQNGHVAIGTTSTTTSKLVVSGIIESTFGGIKFPDGSVQLSAAASSPGSVSQWTENGLDISYTSGRVGIGTASPTQALDVSGYISATGLLTTGAVQAGGQIETSQSGGYVTLGSLSSTQAYLMANAGQSLRLGTGYTQNAVFITADITAKVGIGKTTPAATLDVSGGVRIGLDSSACAVTNAGTLRYSSNNLELCNGSAWVSTAGASLASASATSDGYLTSVDWNNFNSKLSTLNLGSASATGTLAIARLPALTGDVTSVSGSNIVSLNNSGVNAGTYAKVTVDAKGRVTSGNALTNSDVTSALGYVPVASGTVVGSQWTTSGGSINYSGNVGIGTSNSDAILNITSTGTGQQLSINGPAARNYSMEFSNNGNGVGIIAQNGYTEFSGIFPSAVFKYSRTYTGANSVGSRGMMYGYPFSDSLSFYNEPTGTNMTSGSTFTPSVKMTITGAGKVGIGTTSPAQQLSVAGMIESTSGGIRFPDGTTQTTASTAAGAGCAGQTKTATMNRVTYTIDACSTDVKSVTFTTTSTSVTCAAASHGQTVLCTNGAGFQCWNGTLNQVSYGNSGSSSSFVGSACP